MTDKEVFFLILLINLKLDVQDVEVWKYTCLQLLYKISMSGDQEGTSQKEDPSVNQRPAGYGVLNHFFFLTHSLLPPSVGFL